MGQDTLDRIRAGDEAALSELLDDEWSRLVRFLGGRLPAEEDAQDAAQEAFVRLWERRETWHSGSARGLLYRIAINVAEDARRRADVRGRKRRESDSRATPTTPADDAELDQARARLHAALEALAPRRREVFRLIRYEGMTYFQPSPPALPHQPSSPTLFVDAAGRLPLLSDLRFRPIISNFDRSNFDMMRVA